MIAPVALLALVSGLAAPQVTPASVTVSTIGKSRPALRADLLSASQSVCRAELPDPIDGAGIDQCVAATYDAALWKAKRAWRADRAVIRSARLER